MVMAIWTNNAQVRRMLIEPNLIAASYYHSTTTQDNSLRESIESESYLFAPTLFRESLSHPTRNRLLAQRLSFAELIGLL